MEEAGRLLSVHDVARRFGIRTGTVYTKVARRELPYIKVGSLVRFRESDIDRYLADRTVSAVK